MQASLKWRRHAKSYGILVGAMICVVLIGSGSARGNEDFSTVYSRGQGPAEVMIFTDYWCPPCQSVEPYLEKALGDLYRSGVRITFVDKPLHAPTPLYSRYFLYAAKTAHSFEEVLRIRRVLFDIAGEKSVEKEGVLLRRLRQNDVRLALFDVQPIFARWTDLIRRFEVRSTPTCIVLRPDHEDIVLKGNREIPQGIDQLLRELASAEKTK
jgi:thiol:disulfide interchange protein DsbA